MPILEANIKWKKSSYTKRYKQCLDYLYNIISFQKKKRKKNNQITWFFVAFIRSNITIVIIMLKYLLKMIMILNRLKNVDLQTEIGSLESKIHEYWQKLMPQSQQRPLLTRVSSNPAYGDINHINIPFLMFWDTFFELWRLKLCSRINSNSWIILNALADISNIYKI